MVPGLGLFPFLFSSSRVISAPVMVFLLMSHRMRNERNPFMWHLFMGVSIGDAILNGSVLRVSDIR